MLRHRKALDRTDWREPIPLLRRGLAVCSRLLPEHHAGIGEIEHGKIKTSGGVTLLRSLKLLRDKFGGGNREVFHCADAQMRLEDHCQEAKLVHVLDVHAELFALLIDTIESGFVD